MRLKAAVGDLTSVYVRVTSHEAGEPIKFSGSDSLTIQGFWIRLCQKPGFLLERGVSE